MRTGLSIGMRDLMLLDRVVVRAVLHSVRGQERELDAFVLGVKREIRVENILPVVSVSGGNVWND